MKVTRKVLLLMLLIFTFAFAQRMYEALTQVFMADAADSILVDQDTAWTRYSVVEDFSYQKLYCNIWSNQTCSLSIYFEIGEFRDTLVADSTFYCPTTEPGDSTVVANWTVPTDDYWRGFQYWSEPTALVRFRFQTTGNGANDTIWFDEMRLKREP